MHFLYFSFLLSQATYREFKGPNVVLMNCFFKNRFWQHVYVQKSLKHKDAEQQGIQEMNPYLPITDTL